MIFSGSVFSAEMPQKSGFSKGSVLKYQPAYSDLAELCSCSNDSILDCNAIGILKSNAKEYVQAIACFTRALESDSTLVSAYLNRAFAKKQLMDYKGSLADYNRAIGLKLTWEESYEAYYNRGLTQALLQNLKGAMANFNYAIKLNPEYADAYFNRSIVKGRIGDYPGELSDINKAILLNPLDPLAFNREGF